MNSCIISFSSFLKKLPLDYNKNVAEFAYSNPILILCDAVLSMNRKYEGFVVPRIKLIEKSNINTLTQLNNIITQGGIEAFSKVWNYKDPKRVEILQNLTRKFLQLKEYYKLDNDLDVLHEWGASTKPQEWESFGIKGIGFTTYQYLRILCGANTIKPDVHIKRAFLEGVGVNKPLGEIVEVIEETAKHLNIQAKQLDYALWSYYSNKKN